ncbi:hypothetical protein [Paraburkholderia flava]|uniref:hypothetical protein n=1 Tax=Paraburkholderia flava TaxID=2547393 RepID=UPI001414F69A|nr:hypothetical protein [Paraburkholderia flava]
MATRIITRLAAPVSRVASLKLPRWIWFVALWCGGVSAAMLLGFAFKVLMNATLFAVA